MTREEAIAELSYIADEMPSMECADWKEAICIAIKALEQEPCEDVCEWFAQYVDIATDIVELRFSDGTVKRAKRGLYMRDIEKSIRKMLIDQIANEKKQEPKWIPVSERLPEIHNYAQEYIVTIKGNFIRTAFFTETNGKSWWSIDDVIAWMPLVEPYNAESEVQE